MRVMYEPWFVQYKVDVVFAGHVHAYERTVSSLPVSLGSALWGLNHNTCLMEKSLFRSCSMTDLCILQERVSNIAYNIVNGLCTPVKDQSAPVYITIGDGGNLEGLATK